MGLPRQVRRGGSQLAGYPEFLDPVAARATSRKGNTFAPPNLLSMCRACPDECLEISGDELWAIIRDNPRTCIGVLLPRTLHDGLDIGFCHRLSDLPMHDVSTVSVQQGAQIVEGAADVEIRNVDVPVAMRSQWLYEPCALTRRLGFQRSRRPAERNTRYVVEGLTQTTFSSSIMKVSRR